MAGEEDPTKLVTSTDCQVAPVESPLVTFGTFPGSLVDTPFRQHDISQDLRRLALAFFAQTTSDVAFPNFIVQGRDSDVNAEGLHIKGEVLEFENL